MPSVCLIILQRKKTAVLIDMPIAWLEEKTGNKMLRDGVSNGWKKISIDGKKLIASEIGKIKIIIAKEILSMISKK
jgi:hypothetical protein